MNMNVNDYEEPYTPDTSTAHNVALSKLPAEELAMGQMNCRDYLLEYHKELSETVPVPSQALLDLLDSMPTISSNTLEADLLCEVFQRSYLEIPVGIYELPITWGLTIREAILNTHWPEYPYSRIQDVFGWSSVFRVGAYLHVAFNKPLPMPDSHWCDVGAFIFELHRRFEPGQYMSNSRLCEFR